MKRIPKTPQRAKFNAPAARFKSTAFWPFPKPKTPEQWWWLATRSGGLPRPSLRREWGIRSPLWGRSHTDGCSKDPSRQKEGSQKSLQTTVNNIHPHAPLLFGRGWGRASIILAP